MFMQTGNAEAMSDAFAKFIHDVSKKVRICVHAVRGACRTRQLSRLTRHRFRRDFSRAVTVGRSSLTNGSTAPRRSSLTNTSLPSLLGPSQHLRPLHRQLGRARRTKQLRRVPKKSGTTSFAPAILMGPWRPTATLSSSTRRVQFFTPIVLQSTLRRQERRIWSWRLRTARSPLHWTPLTARPTHGSALPTTTLDVTTKLYGSPHLLALRYLVFVIPCSQSRLSLVSSSFALATRSFACFSRSRKAGV